MITFDIPDMTCGHCASTITRAVKQAAPEAIVTIDLERRRVSIEPKTMTATELREVLGEAGYAVVQVDTADGRD